MIDFVNYFKRSWKKLVNYFLQPGAIYRDDECFFYTYRVHGWKAKQTRPYYIENGQKKEMGD